MHGKMQKFSAFSSIMESIDTIQLEKCQTIHGICQNRQSPRSWELSVSLNPLGWVSTMEDQCQLREQKCRSSRKKCRSDSCKLPQQVIAKKESFRIPFSLLEYIVSSQSAQYSASSTIASSIRLETSSSVIYSYSISSMTSSQMQSASPLPSMRSRKYR